MFSKKKLLTYLYPSFETFDVKLSPRTFYRPYWLPLGLRGWSLSYFIAQIKNEQLLKYRTELKRKIKSTHGDKNFVHNPRQSTEKFKLHRRCSEIRQSSTFLLWKGFNST